MLSIVCFELIPHSLEISSFEATLIGVALGIATMIFCESFIRKHSETLTISSAKKQSFKASSMLKTGSVIAIGLALHNFPEGVAIGSRF
jgi:ZIP family zinc transporter